MAGPNGLQDTTWDSATSAFFRWGATLAPLTKYSPPKMDIKVEKPPRIGEALARVRTPGRAEIADASCEMLLSDYEAIVLPRMPVHAGTNVEFVVTATVTHPSVIGSFAQLADGVRIIGEEGPEYDGTEKALIMKLTLSVMNVWRKGRDGKWKSLAPQALPSSQAVPLLKF